MAGRGEPRWMKSKYGGTCSNCGIKMNVGDDIFYDPSSSSAFCAVNGCGQQAEKEYNQLVGKQ
jgi:hypothetical protein